VDAGDERSIDESINLLERPPQSRYSKMTMQLAVESFGWAALAAVKSEV